MDAKMSQDADPWHAVFLGAETPMYVVDAAGKVADANRAFEEFIGYSRERLRGCNAMDLVVSQDRERTDGEFKFHFALGGRHVHERRFLNSKATVAYAKVTTTVVEQGGRVQLVEIREQTGTHARTARLVQSHDLFRQIVDTAPLLIFIRDLEGRYVMVNQAYAKLYGLSPRDMEGRRPADFFPPELAEDYLAHDHEVLEAGGPLSFEESSEGEGGSRHWLAVKTPLYDADGNVVGVAGMSSEITVRKRFEQELRRANRKLEAANQELRAIQEQLIQAEKMESVGRLAAGVAHEVKNPLASILMGVEYLSQIPQDVDPNLGEILEEMRKAVRRAEKIVHGMVDFSAQRRLEFKQVDVNKVVRDVLPFVKHERLRLNVGLLEELAPDLPPVSIDVPKFEQMLLNLFLNALHAMGGDGGTLRIWTAEGIMAAGDPTDPGSRAAERIRKGDPVVVVGVEDTGCGIAAADLERIFDPFFTTKPTGEGTGLGLSICRKIIELHGGRIVAFSQPGLGATMSILLRALPRTPREISGNKPDAVHVESRRREPTP